MTDIESNWHYTVLLQSLYRYLYIKESLKDLDEDYHYALGAFLHYASWVNSNEQTYLENAEKLIYPNDTWVAQDLRKACILLAYSRYCDASSKESVLLRANYFKNSVIEHFTRVNNRTTRILVILIQNQMSLPEETTLTNTTRPISRETTSSKARTHKIVMSLFKDLVSRTLTINIKNEIAYLKHRM
jgi:hypothetical protein